MRRRDVLMLMGAVIVTGCNATPGHSGNTVPAPDVPRLPRANRVAFGAAGLGWLRDTTLEIRDEAGGPRLSLPVSRGLGLIALGDGRLLALDRSQDQMLAVVVAADDTVLRVVAPLSLAREPVNLLADPTNGQGFWLVSEDRQTALRYEVAADGGAIRELSRVALRNSAGSDVIPLRGGGLLIHNNSALVRVGVDGVAVPIAWSLPAPIERFAVLSNELALALDITGGLHWIDLGAEAALATVALGGRCMALSADTAGLAALTGTRERGGVVTWTLHLLGADRDVRWTAQGTGEPGRSLALSASSVALGDGLSLRVWARQDGTALLKS